MRWLIGVCAVLVVPVAMAQQGWLPLGSPQEAAWGARMHRWKTDGHSSVKPYLREDGVELGPDTAERVLLPGLSRLADPTRKFHAGPLLDAMGGYDVAATSTLTQRLGAGAWATWNPAARWSLHLAGRSWWEELPAYADAVANDRRAVAGEGFGHRSGSMLRHHDITGHVDYKAGKYFHLTLGRGKHFFGEGLRSLFLSDAATSYPYLKVTTTVWKFRYTNLFTLMDDFSTVRTGPAQAQRKFTSMHYLSWNASRRLNVSVFEAIVWQDNDPRYPRGFDLSYVNPVVLYRPVEFGLGSPDNALLGVGLNLKVGRKGMVYTQFMLDEFLLANVREGRGWYGNKQGFQAGVVLHDALRVDGLLLRGEFNYVRPFMYGHTDARQSYAHFGESLAHPYGSGFWEGLLQGEWRRDGWVLNNVVSYALMGQDTSAAANKGWGNDIFRSDRDRPLRDGVRPENFGYYVGGPVAMGVLHNELSVARVLDTRLAMELRLAYTYRAELPDAGDARTGHWLRLGLVTAIGRTQPFQALRYRP